MDRPVIEPRKLDEGSAVAVGAIADAYEELGEAEGLLEGPPVDLAGPELDDLEVAAELEGLSEPARVPAAVERLLDVPHTVVAAQLADEASGLPGYVRSRLPAEAEELVPDEPEELPRAEPWEFLPEEPEVA